MLHWISFAFTEGENQRSFQLRNCSDPIGNGVFFPDVMKAVWDAKAIGDVTKKILKKQPAPETESSALIQQAEDK